MTDISQQPATPITADPYPFDITTLEKGSYIEPATLEALTRCDRMSYQYSLKLMPIREWIERELDACGRPATVVQSGFGLKILTDAEASTYNDNRCTSTLKQFKASLSRMARVDHTQLDDGQRERHARRLAYRGAQVAALNSARRRALSKITAKELTNG